MIELSKDKIIERFRSYVALDTASDDKSETSPSTAKQLKLAKLLKSEPVSYTHLTLPTT